MKIWIIDHYSVPPKYYPLARNTNFAKKLKGMGHELKIICASSVHNSKTNLIKGNDLYVEKRVDGIDYIYIKCTQYYDNGIKRVINMLEFGYKLPKVCNIIQKKIGKPNVIIACSMTLQACDVGIKIAHRYGAKAVAQYTDLWPETLVSYGGYSKYNPAVLYLRKIEKRTYINADEIIFSAEGMYDYIIEQGWEKEIPREKSHYINNGIDLEWFNSCKEKYQIEDDDLDNSETFKVIYTGSIKKVNNLGLLLDVAKKIKNNKIRLLIWGDGEERLVLEKRIQDEAINNVVFKGRVNKKYIPYIVSKADLNIAHNTPSPLFRFGISFNKIFDYLAAGKPVLSDFPCKYNPAVQAGAGTDVNKPSPELIAKEIEKYLNMDEESYNKMCVNALASAREYDFKNLSKEFVAILE